MHREARFDIENRQNTDGFGRSSGEKSWKYSSHRRFVVGVSDFFAVDFDELTGLFGAAEVEVVQLFQEFV